METEVMVEGAPMVRSRRSLLLAAILGVSAVVTGCGAEITVTPAGPPSGTATPGAPATTTAPPASPTPPPTATPAPTSPAATSTAAPTAGTDLLVSVYLVRSGRVAPAHRRVSSAAPARAALNALVQGPTGREAAAGMSTDVPAGTALLGISISGGVATVDLSGGFGAGPGDSLDRRLAQVTYTLTQFSTVRSVVYRLNGAAVSALGDVRLAGGVTRADFEPWTPAILVESPAVGDAVRTPLRIWGTADTFEAVFRISLTVAGAVVFDRQVTATAGTGTRGTFDVTVPVAARGDAVLTAYEVSMKDGSRIHVVEVPIVVLP